MAASSSGQLNHPIFARIYDRANRIADARGGSDYREELLRGLHGRVVEVGAGSGPNFPHYPDTVTEVVAIEPEQYLRKLAERSAADASVPIKVIDGRAESIRGEDEGFDASVSSLLLCSVDSQNTVLAELYRVTRPGGELRFFEHVRAEERGLARVQRIADYVWPLLAAGCHTHRDTLRTIEESGFRVKESRKLSFRPCIAAFLTSPHVIGTAVRI